MLLLELVLASLASAEGTPMVGELLAVVCQAPWPYLDARSGAQDPGVLRAVRQIRSATAGRRIRVEDVLVVLIVTDFGVAGFEPLQPEVGVRSGTDDGAPREQVELTRPAGVPVA